jgi:Zn-dependent peptidase ImmA (M78 family)
MAKKKNMFKVPKKFIVLGLEVEIVIVENLHDSNGQKLWGCWETEHRKITLEKNQSPDSMKRTLIHELGHALLDRNGAKYGLSAEMAEVIVEGYSNLITDNDWL